MGGALEDYEVRDGVDTPALARIIAAGHVIARADGRAADQDLVVGHELAGVLEEQRVLVPRAAQQQEIDLIEDNEGKLKAFEFKWGKSEKVRFPQTFTDNYKGVETFVVSQSNIEEFLLK